MQIVYDYHHCYLHIPLGEDISKRTLFVVFFCLKLTFRALLAINQTSGYSFNFYDPDNVDPLANPLLYHHDPMSGCPAPIQNITVRRPGESIVFVNKRPEGYSSNCPGDDTKETGIHICEVVVMGKFRRRY